MWTHLVTTRLVRGASSALAVAPVTPILNGGGGGAFNRKKAKRLTQFLIEQEQREKAAKPPPQPAQPKQAAAAIARITGANLTSPDGALALLRDQLAAQHIDREDQLTQATATAAANANADELANEAIRQAMVIRQISIDNDEDDALIALLLA